MRAVTLFAAFIIVCSMTFSSTVHGQVQSYPITSTNADYNSDGFIYALPMNVFKIDVHVVKSDRYKGKYSDYAAKLLGLSDVITKDATTYSIKKVEIQTLTEVDTNNIYFAQFPDKMKDDKSFMINLNEKGFISSFYATEKNDKNSYKTNIASTPFRDLLKPAQIEKVDTIIRRVSIDTTVIEEKVLRRSISEKSLEQQAKEIADLIYKIEDNKFSIITGYSEVNYSKESMQFMLDNLNKTEKEYLAYFKGSIVNSDEVFTFYFTPGSKPENTLNSLFRFSASEGVIDKQAQGGEVVSIVINPVNNLNKVRNFETSRLQAKRKVRGLYYRIPELAVVNVKIGNRTLAVDKLHISQMGTISFLPSNSLSNAEFNSNGSLKSIIIE